MLAALRLLRLLPKQFMTTRECPEKLVVQIVAVGEHDECGILHSWFEHETAGVERHCERFAGALRVPHDAHPFVANLTSAPRSDKIATLGLMLHVSSGCRRSTQSLLDGHVHSMELMITCHLLRQSRPVVLEHDEMPDEIEETKLVEHPAQQHFQLRHCGGRDRFTFDGTPG